MVRNLILLLLCLGLVGCMASRPKNINNAIEQLKELSGKTHKQTSGISLCFNGKIIWSYVEEAELTMNELRDKLGTQAPTVPVVTNVNNQNVRSHYTGSPKPRDEVLRVQNSVR